MSKLFVLREFWEFLKYRKQFWLLPIVVVLFVFGLLIATAPPAVLPFIYPF